MTAPASFMPIPELAVREAVAEGRRGGGQFGQYGTAQGSIQTVADSIRAVLDSGQRRPISQVLVALTGTRR